MENSVKWRGRANVVVYENNDVDVRIPEENENLKLQTERDLSTYRRGVIFDVAFTHDQLTPHVYKPVNRLRR